MLSAQGDEGEDLQDHNNQQPEPLKSREREEKKGSNQTQRCKALSGGFAYDQSPPDAIHVLAVSTSRPHGGVRADPDARVDLQATEMKESVENASVDGMEKSIVRKFSGPCSRACRNRGLRPESTAGRRR